MAIHPATLAPHLPAHEQDHETRVLGMWVFLMTELMLFGGLFAAYFLYRYAYPDAFAIGSSHLDAGLGAINTAVLILSSLNMALAVSSAQSGERKAVVVFLVLTLLFGAGFMGIKALEYYQHYVDRMVPGLAFDYAGPQAPMVQLFVFIYFAMTGLHAIHLTIGMVLVGYMTISAWRGHVTRDNWTSIELTGLYWHFVDIVWIFIFPLLYLNRPG